MDVPSIRKEFPLLEQKINGSPLVYLDNAATTQKPRVVTDALLHYYHTLNSNIHRGVHHLSQKATDAFEESRECVRRFMNAARHEEIIFTKGTTEAINLVANGFARALLKEGDRVLVTVADHHSDFVPWQQACLQNGAVFDIMPVQEDGTLDLNLFEQKLALKPKLVAFPHISNVLGLENPVKRMCAMAHAQGTAVLVDGAQGIAHCPVDVIDLDCDFYCWSAHKMYGSTGIGVLYGKTEWLEKLPPYQFGGEMIEEVDFQQTSFAALPFKFEAGTPPIAEAITLKNAIEFVQGIGFDALRKHETRLTRLAIDGLHHIEGVRIYGKDEGHSGVVSFNIDGAYHYDAGVILDQLGVAVRTGHHCAQPLMKHLGIPGCIRASFAVYNTEEEVEKLLSGVRKAAEMLI
ncbi:MAG: cysteine desulfurase [Bacteroides sp.]|nr:cysteine desulfurase [Bacteroides sp.]MCM1085207.1 cysteine desulfurase [Bacteroides sp.]